MDLTRWGLPKFTRISDRYRNFQEFLGQVLEGDRSLLNGSGAVSARRVEEPPLAVRDDIERLLESPVPSRGRQLRAESVFQSLAPFFEAGFLLKTEVRRDANRTDAQLKSMFLFGRAFEPPNGEGPRVSIGLPRIPYATVLRGRIRPLLKLFHLTAIKTLNEASVFAFSPRPGWVILLVCNRPHLWQVGAIEKAHNVVHELFDKGAIK